MNVAGQLQFMRALSGPPAHVFLVLLLRGVSMTNFELCYWTGMSDKPITLAIRLLEGLGLLQYNGRANGWSLRAGYQEMLPFTDQIDASYPQPVDKEIGDTPIYASSSSSSNEEEGMKKREKQAVDRNISDLASGVDRNISDLLVGTGISPKSVKGREIINARLDPAFVAAHVAAWREEGSTPPGHLIKRLLDGDPLPPAPRGRAHSGHIPAEYADIIKR